MIVKRCGSLRYEGLSTIIPEFAIEPDTSFRSLFRLGDWERGYHNSNAVLEIAAFGVADGYGQSTYDWYFHLNPADIIAVIKAAAKAGETKQEAMKSGLESVRNELAALLALASGFKLVPNAVPENSGDPEET